MKNEVRVIGEYDSDDVSMVNALRCPEETRTNQEFKQECDINTIISRFGIGENPVAPQDWVTDVDIENAPADYQSVMNQLNEAREQFMSLPAKVRTQFDNDPAKFVSFVSDEKNGEELVRMGLAKVREPAKPSDTDRVVEAIKEAAKPRAQGSS